MKTVAIQIGNSDDKLTQWQWADYVMDLHLVVQGNCGQVHFRGHSAGDSRWQNHCVVAECKDAALPTLYARLGALAREYGQDSIAVTVGDTMFVC